MQGEEWRAVEAKTKVVEMSWVVRALVPALLLSSLPERTRAVSYEGGRFGFVVGAVIASGSLAVGAVLYKVAWVAGPVVAFWAIGSSGIVMMASAFRPVAFVKPICTRCRLLPIIREHEAIHMSGVEKESEVWDSMKKRYSSESLALRGDPAICSFCPIPKRLEEG
jgi:type IV secretory pathway TrbD component